jgi:hypothetical protein
LVKLPVNHRHLCHTSLKPLDAAVESANFIVKQLLVRFETFGSRDDLLFVGLVLLFVVDAGVAEAGFVRIAHVAMLASVVFFVEVVSRVSLLSFAIILGLEFYHLKVELATVKVRFKLLLVRSHFISN